MSLRKVKSSSFLYDFKVNIILILLFSLSRQLAKSQYILILITKVEFFSFRYHPFAVTKRLHTCCKIRNIYEEYHATKYHFLKMVFEISAKKSWSRIVEICINNFISRLSLRNIRYTFERSHAKWRANQLTLRSWRSNSALINSPIGLILSTISQLLPARPHNNVQTHTKAINITKNNNMLRNDITNFNHTLPHRPTVNCV